MKTKLITLFTAILIVIACGKDGGLGFFIPNFSNLWFSDRNSTFDFDIQNPNTNESDFSGTESNNDDGSRGDLTGHYKNYDVSFTFINGKDSGVTYKGRFVKDVEPLTMKVTGDKNGVLLTISKN
jgi:hypothetical protein